MAKSVSKKLGAALFNAVRNASGTTTASLFDGFGTIAAAEISAGNIAAAKGNYMTTAAITANNVGDVLKSIYDNASEELQDASNLKLFIPKAVKNLYDDWFLAHFGAVSYNAAYGRKYLHGTDDKCEIVALPGLKNSPYIYLSTKDNMLVGCDQLDASGKEKVLVRVPDNPKVVQFFMCFFWGVQFQMIEKEYLMVAAPASVSPSVVITGDQLIDNLAATAGSNVRTYSTSDGSAVTAEVVTEGANWLSVAVAAGNKVTFTRTAYAHAESGDNPRIATVRISAGGAHLDVVVKQAMAAE